MTRVTCRLTAKNRDQRRNPTLGNLVWATCTFFTLLYSHLLVFFMFRHKCVCRNIRERTYVVLHVVNKLKPDAPPNKNLGHVPGNYRKSGHVVCASLKSVLAVQLDYDGGEIDVKTRRCHFIPFPRVPNAPETIW